MKHTGSLRPTPALIVAVVALVAALAGTSVAAPDDEGGINKKVVKKIAKKKANQQINKRLPWGAADLAPSSVVADKLANINTHSQTVTVPATGFPGTEAVVNCGPNENLISGGVRSGNETLIGDMHQQGEGWRARVVNLGGAPEQVQVEAYCLAATPTP